MKGNGIPVTLYENIFEIEVMLSERFPSLNPLEIDEFEAVQVFTLLRDLNLMSDRKNREKKAKNGTNTRKKGKKVFVKIES